MIHLTARHFDVNHHQHTQVYNNLGQPIAHIPRYAGRITFDTATDRYGRPISDDERAAVKLHKQAIRSAAIQYGHATISIDGDSFEAR